MVAFVALTTLLALSAAAAPQLPTFKSGVEYVEVDVVVTNAQGQFVRNLARSDFQILEDGKPQAMTAFALVDVPIERFERPLKAGTSPRIEPDVTTNEHADGRVYVLLIDDLHIAPLGVQRTKAAARLFIERLGANDLMAVVHTAGVDAASQEFTSSKRRLLAAVDQTTGHGLASSVANRNDSAVKSGGLDTTDHEDLERAENAQTTLRVLRDVSNWFATVHGRRKAILLMSEGIDYPMTMEDKPDQPNRPTDMVLATAQEGIDAARRSNVSIYGIDPAGLTGISDISIDYFFGPNDRAMGPRALQRESQMEQDSLRRLSEETGGIAAVGRTISGRPTIRSWRTTARITCSPTCLRATSATASFTRSACASIVRESPRGHAAATCLRAARRRLRRRSILPARRASCAMRWRVLCRSAGSRCASRLRRSRARE